MPEPATHPSPAELTAYGLGQLPPDEATVIERHISECEPCCETIADLSSDDTFVGLLQKARQTPTDQTVDQDGVAANASSQDVPVPLSEHPRYAIVGLIGKGGMGDVYKARHRKMERTVALKVINRELVRKPEAVDRFHREVKTAAQLSHPNIVTAHDADQAGDFHFMVMEYVDGVDLSHVVKDRGKLPVAEACNYLRQAAIGLQYAHEQGMVHRDIKPHNLMVTADGTVKILDFGLASLAPETGSDDDTVEARGELTAGGAIMGTPDFISPEQAEDARKADIRSDIYSLGATLYFLLSGQPPFAEGSVIQKLNSHAKVDPEPLDSVRDDIPAELATLISRMMAKVPDERFQTPEEVAEALAQFASASHEDSPASEQAAKSPHAKSAKALRHRGPISVTALAGLFLAMIAAVVLYVQINKTTLRFEINDPDVRVSFAGEMIRVDTADNKTFLVEPSTVLKFVVYQSGTEVETDSLTLRRGQKVVLKIDVVKGQIKIALSDRDVQVTRNDARGKLAGHDDGAVSADERIQGTRTATYAEDRGRDDRDYPVAIEPSVRFGSAPFRFGGRISSLEYSLDGKRLLSAGGNWGAAVWNAETGELVRHFTGGNSYTTADFSADGRYVAVAGDSPGPVPVWDVETGKQVCLIYKGGAAGRFAPDGKSVITQFKNRLTRYEIESGQQLPAFSNAVAQAWTFAVPREGTLVAGSSERGDIRVWDWKTGKQIAESSGAGPATHNVRGLAFTPDGESLIVLGEWNSNTIKVCAARTLEVTRMLKTRRQPRCLNMSGDGTRVAVGCSLGLVHVFDLVSGDEINAWEAHSATESVSAVALSPDGKRLACGTDESGSIRIWEVETNKELSPAATGHSATVGEIAVLKDGTVISQDHKRTFGRWDPNTGTATHFWKWPGPLEFPTEWALCSQTGRTLSGYNSLLLTTDPTDPQAFVDVYAKAHPPTERGRKTSEIFGIKSGIHAVALSADGRRAAAAHINDRVVVCDLDEFSYVRTFTLPKVQHLAWDREYSLALSSDGRLLAGSSQDKAVLWDVATGTELDLPKIDFDITSLAFSPNGNTLAFSGIYKVLLWNVNDEQVLRTIVDQERGVRSIAFSPDGKLFAVGSLEFADSVALWDMTSGRRLRELRGARGGGASLAFSHDGSKLYAGTGSSLIVGWDLHELGKAMPVGANSKDVDHSQNEFDEIDRELYGTPSGRAMMAEMYRRDPDEQKSMADKLLAQGKEEAARRVLTLVVPPDPKATAALELAKLQEKRGDLEKAADAYLEAYRITPALLNDEHLPAIRKSGRVQDLVEVLTEERLRSLPYINRASRVVNQLLKEEATRAEGYKLHRRWWAATDRDHYGWLNNPQHEVFWKEVPDPDYYLRSKLLPVDFASEGNGWNRFRVEVWGVPLSDDPVWGIPLGVEPLLHNKAVLRQMAAEAEAAIEQHPGWKAGPALLSFLKAEVGDTKQSIELLRQVLADAENHPIPPQSAWVFGLSLEGKDRELDQLVMRLYEHSLENWLDEDELRESPIGSLAKLYAKYDRRQQARQVVYRLAVDDYEIDIDQASFASVICSDGRIPQNAHRCTACHKKERNLLDVTAMSQELTDIGYPVDALISLYRIDASFGNAYGSDDEWVKKTIPEVFGEGGSEFVSAKTKAEKAVTPEAVIEALKSGVFSNRDMTQPAPANSDTTIDLMLSVRGEGGKSTVFSPVVDVLALAAKSNGKDAGKEIFELDKRLVELLERDPESVEAGISATVFAFLRDDVDAAEDRMKKLKALRPAAPEKPQPGDIALWLVARHALANERTQAIGVQLADRALAAAEKQSDPQFKSAIDREREAILGVR